ncbi:hypothetical protein OS493_006443 [Desmophyllum pertusum]|uniref:ZU5 domain-containing protein n=1 Tax=Desmophyllum pertusum TaxID=174260 RepID=A0A9X0DCY7_9CNID|nr:hypothetical protein OS493_006443 [Desmophyllum pertusum]
MATIETRSDNRHNNSEELEQEERRSISSVEDVQNVEPSNVVTSDGGSVSVKGAKLICPTGAVDDPVTIKLKLEEPYSYCGLIVHNGLENDVIFGAPIINCQPNGQMFKKHVTLTVALDNEIKKSIGALLVLHGTPTNDGKIFWEDITHNSQFDLEKEELQVEINQFSLIAVLLRLTWVQAKEIVTRFNLVSFKYTLSVLFKSNHQHSPFDELALVFMSQDSYQEPLYREHEDSALMQLKRDGFEELGSKVEQESGYIYNEENLTVSIQLGEDYKLVNNQQERVVTVESPVWWSTGHVIRVSLQSSSADAKILCGRVAVHGQHGHVLEDYFSQSDLCGYVRRLLGVEKVICNLTPVAQKLGLHEETLNQVVACWQSEAKQLEIILLRWRESQGNTEDPDMLRNAFEGLEPEGINYGDNIKTMYVDKGSIYESEGSTQQRLFISS